MSPSAGGAEQRVDQGVGQDVGVGVRFGTMLGGDRDAAEDERTAGNEAV